MAAAAVVIAWPAPRWRRWPWPRRDGGGERGPRRERSEGGNDDDGPAPEFAPAFLTGDRD